MCPCIATLTGQPIGGWSPYSHSPTTAGWLSYHFYQQWKYGMDSQFLKERAYPWVKEVARFFENVSVYDKQGKRKLPLSSSPEINDNRIDAWFMNTTNYDLANIRITYTVAKEMAEALGLMDEAAHYARQLDEWPDEAVDESGLLIAPGKPMDESHRHFSHLLSFHPFGLLWSVRELKRLILFYVLSKMWKIWSGLLDRLYLCVAGEYESPCSRW